MAEIVIASRASPLALLQAGIVATAMRRHGMACRVKSFSTAGDEITDRPLADIGGKELFVTALRQAMQKGRADLAVHSLKDMAAKPSPEFTLAAVGFGEDPRDVCVSQKYPSLQELPAGATVGTCSPRRIALLSRHLPQLRPVMMRGNLQTRRRRLQEGACDALLLAAAGLQRLRMLDQQCQHLPPEVFIPAPGQGLLAVECPASNEELIHRLTTLNDADAMCRANAERAFAAAVDGDCQTPLGAHATLVNQQIRLHAFYAGDGRFADVHTTAAPDNAAAAGRAAARALLP